MIINGTEVTIPGTPGTYSSSGVSQMNKTEKFWVFDNVEKSPDTLILRVECVALKEFSEVEFFYAPTAVDTIKKCFGAILKKPEFIDDEMTRMRLSDVEDIRHMAMLMAATQKFSVEGGSATIFSEMVNYFNLRNG